MSSNYIDRARAEALASSNRLAQLRTVHERCSPSFLSIRAGEEVSSGLKESREVNQHSDAEPSVCSPARAQVVASKDDDDGGDPDPEPERWRLHNSQSSSSALLHLSAVISRCALSRSHIYSLIRQELFPSPVKLGRASRWVASEIDEWIKSHMSQRLAA